MKKNLKKPIPSKAKDYELQFKLVKEREELRNYVHLLIEKIENRLDILESQKK
ncbi:MAG: hypothetical protein GT598_15690 [Bacteroidales bacterium]|nr:hypothetical protein [Bacteroidales bacterium]